MLFFNNILRRGQDERTRELQKLRRQDLLELLLDQMREGEALQTALADRERKIEQLTDLSERLKAKLDLKDEQIERLKGRLDLKDAMIAQMIASGRKAPVDLELMEELLIAEEHAIEALLVRQAEEQPAIANESAKAAELSAETQSTPSDDELLTAFEPRVGGTVVNEPRHKAAVPAFLEGVRHG